MFRILCFNTRLIGFLQSSFIYFSNCQIITIQFDSSVYMLILYVVAKQSMSVLSLSLQAYC